MIVKFTFDNGIDKFISSAKGSVPAVDEMEDRIIRKAGKAGLENVASKIQKRTGALAQSYTPGSNRNVFHVQSGNGKASVRYGSNLPYAEAHEKGYNQLNRVNKKSGKKPSLWVPGNWKGGEFSYNGEQGVKTGMRLSGRFVPGGHEFELSIPDTQEDYKDITKKEIERLFKALF